MGSMNVGKVSFGNAPVAGTTQAAAQQAAVKKADKGDVVVIGGKEIRKSTIVKGGIVATAVAALGTLAAAAKRGKVQNGADAKLVENLKTGFKSIFTKDGRAAYKTAKAAGEKAAGAATDKATDAVNDKAQEAATTAADNAAKTTDAAADKTGEAVKTDAPQSETGVKQQPEAPKAGDKAKALKSEELKATLQKFDKDIAEAQQTVDNLSEKQKNLVKNINKANTNKTKLEADLVSLETDYQKALANDNANATNGTKRVLDRAEKARNDKQAELDKVKAELEAFEKDKKAVDGQLTGAQNKLTKAQNAKNKNQAQIEQKLLEAKVDEMMAGDKKIKVKDNAVEYVTAETELTNTNKALEDAKAKAQEITAKNDQAQKGYEGSIKKETDPNKIAELQKRAADRQTTAKKEIDALDIKNLEAKQQAAQTRFDEAKNHLYDKTPVAKLTADEQYAKHVEAFKNADPARQAKIKSKMQERVDQLRNELPKNQSELTAKQTELAAETDAAKKEALQKKVDALRTAIVDAQKSIGRLVADFGVK